MNAFVPESLPFPATFEVCVLIPVYNNLPGLIQSLQSLSYTSGKLCVLVIDDGSDVPLDQEKIFSEAGNGFTIYSVSLPGNKGITVALNTGLAWIERNLKVKYVARLDCADVCSPDRFYKQAGFLKQHPEIGLLGSWVTFKQPVSGFQYQYKTPTEHREIVSEMYFRNVFIHPAVMFRTELLLKTGYYPAGFQHVEDYAFFMEFLKYTKAAVLPEFLVTCEINPGGISIKNRKAQLRGRHKVIDAYGTDSWLKLLGKLKIKMLEMLPYGLILKLKNGMAER